MDEPTRMALAELGRLRDGLQSRLTSAGGTCDQINLRIEEIVMPAALSGRMILGDIVFDTRNNKRVLQTSKDLLLQAALGIGSGGLGAVIWSAAEYEQFIQNPSGSTDATGLKFRRFNECPEEIRNALLPFVSVLINRFIETVRSEAAEG